MCIYAFVLAPHGIEIPGDTAALSGSRLVLLPDKVEMSDGFSDLPADCLVMLALVTVLVTDVLVMLADLLIMASGSVDIAIVSKQYSHKKVL